jgi:hypothetical protein
MTKRPAALLLAALLVTGGGLWAVTPATPGYLEGDLRVYSEKGVDLADKPSPTPDETSYKEYRLTVFSKDHRTEIAEVPVDEHGHYRLPLPPGDYVLDVKKGKQKRLRVAPHAFTITSQQTARVNMEIDTAFPPPM